MFRGEVWLINLDPTIGAEIQKIRPAIIVNADDIGILPLRVIVPITDWKDRYNTASWLVKIEPDAQNKIDKISAADAFQVRSLSQLRFVRKIGKVTNKKMLEIEKALAVTLKISNI